MGGGSGDGGNAAYEAKQAQIEARKAAARDALNRQFGVAAGGGVAPTRESFTTSTPGGYVPGGGGGRESDGNEGYYSPAANEGYYSPAASSFDQAGYDSAMAGFSADAVGNVDAAKNKTGRDALYGQIRDNAFTAGKRGLDEGNARAHRLNGFELFARGLNGGSEDIDQNALLGRTYSQGLLDLGAKADAARTDIQSSDEQTRLGLLQSIDNGMDQGSAISSAINQMQNASNKAAADAQGLTLGDLFERSGALYTKSQKSQGQAAGEQDWWNQYNNRGGTRTPSSARSGATSQTYEGA